MVALSDSPDGDRRSPAPAGDASRLLNKLCTEDDEFSTMMTRGTALNPDAARPAAPESSALRGLGVDSAVARGTAERCKDLVRKFQ